MPANSSQKISDESRSRIKEAALRYPKRGPRRLARLLKGEGLIVSTSTIYRILRAEGLHTLEKRHKQAHVMINEPTHPETVIQPPAEEKTTIEMPPSDRHPVFETLLPSKPARRGLSVGMSGSILRGLRLFQAVLVILAMSLGVFAALHFKAMPKEKETITEASPDEALQGAPEREKVLRSINYYQAVWKRDLFGTAASDQTIRQKPPAPEEIPKAPEDLGLKLVGTAATEIRNLSIAVIENSKTLTQEPFREGDRIGDLRIKRIFRSSVVIVTDAGEVLLAMGDGSSGPDGAGSDEGVAKAEDNRIYSIEIARDGQVTESYSTDQKWVTASLGNARKMKRVRFLPHTKNDRPDGLQVRMPTLHVLTRLGLRSSDLIQRINGMEATEPRQAEDALSRLGKGEDLDIELLRGGEPWRVRVHAS